MGKFENSVGLSFFELGLDGILAKLGNYNWISVIYFRLVISLHTQFRLNY